MFAAIPICNVVITIIIAWKFFWNLINNKYEIKQRVKDGNTSIKNRIKSIAKKTLNVTLDIIDKCPPRANDDDDE